MTMGIVTVASLAGRVDSAPPVTMTSTLRRTSSAASAGRRSSFPSPYRHSMTIFFPSTYPSSRRPCAEGLDASRIQQKRRPYLGNQSVGFSLAAGPPPFPHTPKSRPGFQQPPPILDFVASRSHPSPLTPVFPLPIACQAAEKLCRSPSTALRTNGGVLRSLRIFRSAEHVEA